MKSNNAVYWILVVIALAGIVASIMMSRSAVESTQHLAKIVGWSAVGLALIARFGFRPKRSTPPPPMKDADR